MGLIRKEMPENYNDLGWIRINEDDPDTFPKTDDYIFLSFSNYGLPAIGRCEGNEDDGFVFYEGDDSMDDAEAEADAQNQAHLRMIFDVWREGR